MPRYWSYIVTIRYRLYVHITARVVISPPYGRCNGWLREGLLYVYVVPALRHRPGHLVRYSHYQQVATSYGERGALTQISVNGARQLRHHVGEIIAPEWPATSRSRHCQGQKDQPVTEERAAEMKITPMVVNGCRQVLREMLSWDFSSGGGYGPLSFRYTLAFTE